MPVLVLLFYSFFAGLFCVRIWIGRISELSVDSIGAGVEIAILDGFLDGDA